MSKDNRDIALMFGVVVLAYVIWRVVGEHVPLSLRFAAPMALVFAGQFALKLIVRDHIVLKQAPVWLLLSAFVLFLTPAILLGDFGLLGLWTWPALAGIGLLGCILVGVVAFLAAKDDKRRGDS